MFVIRGDVRIDHGGYNALFPKVSGAFECPCRFSIEDSQSYAGEYAAPHANEKTWSVSIRF